MLPQRHAYTVARQLLKSDNPDSDYSKPVGESSSPETGQFIPGLTNLNGPDLQKSLGKSDGSTTLRRQQVAQISRIIGNKSTEHLVQRVLTKRRGAIINSANPNNDESKSNSNIVEIKNDNNSNGNNESESKSKSNSNIIEIENNNGNSESESKSSNPNIVEIKNDKDNDNSNNSESESKSSNPNIVEIKNDNNSSNESESNMEVSESNINSNSNVTSINKRNRGNVIKILPTKVSVQSVINPNKAVPTPFSEFLENLEDKKLLEAVNFMRELAKRLNELGTGEIIFKDYKAEGGVDAWIRENFDKIPSLEKSRYQLLLGKLNPTKDSNELLEVKTTRDAIELMLEGVVAGIKSLLNDLCVDFNVKYNLEKAKTSSEVFEEHKVDGTKFVDSNLKGKRQLGKGGMNTVFEMDYGDKGTKVWKEDQNVDYLSHLHNGGRVGIPSEKPEYSKRAVAMYRLDQLLGADVIPPTDFSVHKGKFGTVMDLAPGKAIVDFLEKKSDDYSLNKDGAVQFKKKLAENQKFKKALAKLQLLDALAGQVDRHLGNVHVDYDESSDNLKSFKGIDNDMAFGKKHKYIHKVFGKEQPLRGGYLMGNSEHLARIKNIDQKFAQKLIDLDSEKLKEILKDLLEESEVEATCKRLDQLQKYLKDKKNESKIVDYE